MAVRRETLPNLSGVYFITPSNESVSRLIEDFQGQPLYKSAHVFFSSPAPGAILAAIRSCPGLTARLKSLKEVLHPTITASCTYKAKVPNACTWANFICSRLSPITAFLKLPKALRVISEFMIRHAFTVLRVRLGGWQVNLEFLVMDRRTFVTDERNALRALFGENGSNSASYKVAVATLCSRLAGVFASLKVSFSLPCTLPQHLTLPFVLQLVATLQSLPL